MEILKKSDIQIVVPYMLLRVMIMTNIIPKNSGENRLCA